jgi:hypothetical protein
VLASQHLGFFAELNVTEIATRGGVGGAASSASGAGSIIDDLRAAVSRELRDLSGPPSPAAAAAADAAAPTDGAVREAPPRSAREELDLLDAQCMLSILDSSKHAMLRAAAGEMPSTATMLPASARRLESSRLDCMVAMATVSLFIDGEGMLITDAGSAAENPAAGGSPVGDSAVATDAKGFATDFGLRDALRPTLRTSFASLRELRLRKSTHWLDFRRPQAGNLLLVEALLHHGCPALEPVRGAGSSDSSAAPLLSCDVGAELSALMDSARAAKQLIDTRAYAAIAARLGPAAWEARRMRPSVRESRPMRLVVRRREAPSRKAGGEPNRPSPALADQVIVAPLQCVAEGFAAAEPLTDGAAVLASVAVPLTQLGLTCTVGVRYAGRAAEASAKGAHNIPVFVALEVTDAMGVTATARSRRPAHVVVAGPDLDTAAGADIGGAAATRTIAHAGLDQLPSDTLSIKCVGRVPASGPGGAHGTHSGGVQLGDVVVELSAIAMY